MKQKTVEILANTIGNYPELTLCKNELIQAHKLMLSCHKGGGLIMTCGNGGSASDSAHIVGELMKGFKYRRDLSAQQREKFISAFPGEGGFLADHLQGAVRAIDLTAQAALATAFANDVEPEMIFAQQVFGYGRPGDLLIGLSTSGNSKNILNACKVAKVLGIKTLAMTGQDGGILSGICDVTIRVPATETFKVQEYHLPVYHALCAMLEEEVWGN